MPKLTGPMFSVEAHGTLADALTYQRRPGGATVYPYKKPKVPLTDRQLWQRQKIAWVVAAWQRLSDEEKEEWEVKAKGQGQSGYSYFIKQRYNEFNLLSNGDFEIGDPPTGWSLGQGGSEASWSRSSEQVKIGSYAVKVTNELDQWATVVQTISPFDYLKGQEVTLGAWIWASVADRVRVSFWDGISVTASVFHPGDSAWHWLTVTLTVPEGATTLDAQVASIVGGSVISAYGDGAVAVESGSCAENAP